jgi:hypothetical protein
LVLSSHIHTHTKPTINTTVFREKDTIVIAREEILEVHPYAVSAQRPYGAVIMMMMMMMISANHTKYDHKAISD